MVDTIGVIYNPRISEAVALSQQLHSLLDGLGKKLWLVQARDLDRPDLAVPDFDLLITLGGDGTILRAARLAAPRRALVLGVNMGQLGFLAELGPADVLAQIPAIVAGGGWVEERMMLRAIIQRKEAEPLTLDGLNDLIVGRGGLPRAMRINVSIEKQHMLTYVADGVLVSTPTGSTAYALALDGPIVHPQLRTLQVAPIAAHLAVVKSVVVPATATVSLTVESKYPSVASVDGQVDVPLADGDAVDITASPLAARFVRVQPRSYFYQTLVARLSTTIVRGLV